MDRRQFLKGGAAALCGLGFNWDPSQLVFPRPPRTEERLRRPIKLAIGDVIEDMKFVSGDDFEWNSTASVIYGQDLRFVTLRNVEIVTTETRFLPRWHDDVPPPGDGPGVPTFLSGLRLARGAHVELDGVYVRGFPRNGIYASGMVQSTFRDIRVSLCHVGLYFHHGVPSYDCLLERIDAGDTWGAALDIAPSVKYPGQAIGGPAALLGGLRNCVVRNVSAVGEHSGLKLVNPQEVICTSLRSPTMMIQGDFDANHPEEPARNVVVEKSTFDKATGSGHVADDANSMQISFNVESVGILDCSFVAGGRNGHAIQLVGDTNAYVGDCTIAGFNGTRGGAPAHALELVGNATINEDFETANRFYDQDRLILRPGPLS